MSSHHPRDPEAVRLGDERAARLLERASELDASQAKGAAVHDLRAAAMEAGISASAFDAALSEMQDDTSISAPETSNTTVALLASRVVGPATRETSSSTLMLEESIALRCLAPGEAAELIRPLLDTRNSQIVVAPARAPRIITVRATAEQLQRVKALLEGQDGSESAACAAPE